MSKRSSSKILKLGLIGLISLGAANLTCYLALRGGWVQESGERGTIYYQRKTPHPYLGFVDRRKANDHPVWSEAWKGRLERVKDESLFRIGIFGGSGASQLYRHWQDNEDIKMRLQKLFAGESKEIEIVEFSNGAYYQPQSLLASLLYASDVDLAISFEGANEVSRNPNEYPLEFPRYRLTHIFYANTLKSHLALLSLDLSMVTLDLLRFFQEKKLFASLSQVLSTLVKSIERKFLSATMDRPDQKLRDYATLVDLWLWSLGKQSLLFRSEGVRHLVFLQPMLCVPGAKKVKSELEQRICEISKELEPEKVIEAFAQVTQKGQRQQIHVENLIQVFHDQDQEAFIDEVHLNEFGLDLVSEKIISRLASQLPGEQP